MGSCRLIASAAASDVGSTEPPPSLEAVLQAELEYEKDDFQVDEEMEKGPEGWTMQMEENNTTVLLSKTFGTEKVVIEMYAEDDDEDDDDDFDFDEFDGEEEGTESEASSADGVAKDGDDLDDELFDDDDIDKMEFFVTVSKTTEADDDESKRLLQFTCIAESGGYFIKKVRPHYQFPGRARARSRSPVNPSTLAPRPPSIMLLLLSSMPPFDDFLCTCTTTCRSRTSRDSRSHRTSAHRSPRLIPRSRTRSRRTSRTSSAWTTTLSTISSVRLLSNDVECHLFATAPHAHRTRTCVAVWRPVDVAAENLCNVVLPQPPVESVTLTTDLKDYKENKEYIGTYNALSLKIGGHLPVVTRCRSRQLTRESFARMWRSKQKF